MILKNDWTFGGEVVRMKDFGDGHGGNITVKGSSVVGDIEFSVFLSETMFKRICDKKYPKVVANGHFEWRTWETDGGNIKHSIRHVADNLDLVS